MEELIQMSRKELNRIRVIEAVKQKQITQRAAGLKLGVSDRQIRNLLRSFSIEGEKALISKKRGRKGNHSKSATLKSEVTNLDTKYLRRRSEHQTDD